MISPKPIDTTKAAQIEAHLAKKHANDTAPAPSAGAPAPRRRGAEIDPVKRAALEGILKRGESTNAMEAGRRLGLNRVQVRRIVHGLRRAGFTILRRPPGRPPARPNGGGIDERGRDEDGIDDDGRDEGGPNVIIIGRDEGAHYQPIIPRHVTVRDFAAEKARATERARLLSELPAERITRIPSGADLYRESIERTQRWADERYAAEAKAEAKKKARRHAEYLRERERSARQEMLDKRDRIGEFSLDAAVVAIEDPETAFRKAMIAAGKSRQARVLARIQSSLTDARRREIVDQLVSDGLIPPPRRRMTATRADEGADKENGRAEAIDVPVDGIGTL